MGKSFSIPIKELKYEIGNTWLKEWAEKHGRSMDVYPYYLALKGDREPLLSYCDSTGNIWFMERLDLLFSVYRSLIRYGQIEPIKLKGDNTIVTGHKRACIMLAMGKETIKAFYE